jgi:hypothetical protein
MCISRLRQYVHRIVGDHWFGFWHDMRVVDGRVGCYSFPLRTYMPEVLNYCSFSSYSHFTLPFFAVSLQYYWRQKHKIIYAECVSSSGHCLWVSDQFEISVLLHAPFLIQANVNYWWANPGLWGGGSRFPSPLLLSGPSHIFCMWVNVAMQQCTFIIVATSFLLNRLVLVTAHHWPLLCSGVGVEHSWHVRLTISPPFVSWLSRHCAILTISQLCSPPQPVMRLALLCGRKSTCLVNCVPATCRSVCQSLCEAVTKMFLPKSKWNVSAVPHEVLHCLLLWLSIRWFQSCWICTCRFALWNRQADRWDAKIPENAHWAHIVLECIMLRLRSFLC